MNCPQCSSKETVKNGLVKGKQRYYCGTCQYNYTTPHGHGKPKELKKKAIELYLEGMGFRAIGRTIGVSNVAVLNWVRSVSEQLRKILKERIPDKKKEIEVMELDEMWHYVGKKREKHGSGLRLIEQLLP